MSLREQIVRKWGSALKRGCYVEIIGGSRMWSVDYDPIKGRFTYTSNPEERVIVVQTLHSDGTLGGLIKRWRYRSWHPR